MSFFPNGSCRPSRKQLAKIICSLSHEKKLQGLAINSVTTLNFSQVTANDFRYYRIRKPSVAESFYEVKY